MKTKILSCAVSCAVMLALFPVMSFAGSPDYVKPARAEYHLGKAYETGIGEHLSYTLAAYWYRKSANQGFARAENNLGVMYEAGVGVPVSFTRARYWFRQAARQGDVTAKNNRSPGGDANGVSKGEISRLAYGGIAGGTPSGINGSYIRSDISSMVAASNSVG